MASNSISIEPKSFIRRILFFTILIGIAIVYIGFTFRGLTSPFGMDQAQIGREVARGHNLTTKSIRPLAIHQLQDREVAFSLNSFHDTTHAPLNILFYAGAIKIFGGDVEANNKMSANQNVFYLDRVIAGTCALFFIIAIGINYLLVTRIFDAKIGAIVAILMMLSQSMWNYTLSGLPQMLMLCIFSGACYLIWKAIENQNAERSAVAPVILAGFLFGLLALAHWLTLWIFVGFLVFAIIHFRPRGIIAIFLVVTVLFFIAGPLIFNANNSDGALGTAFYFVQGKTGIDQDNMFRTLEEPVFNMNGIILNIVQTTFLQTNEIHRHLGGFVLATAFFLSLMHPFKRSTICSYRWCIFSMWGFAAFGMSVYGISNSPIDPNQMHILFMPLMSAFALALISILWARIPLSQYEGVAKNLPFIIIIIITASPITINFINEVRNSQYRNTVPGYNANNNNRLLTDEVKPNDIVFSDQPWAVAWYADRVAIWTPKDSESMTKIMDIAKQTNGNIIGLHRTPFLGQISGNADVIVDKNFPNFIPLMTPNSKRASGFVLFSKNKPSAN